MRASFPTTIEAVLLGKSREAGEFQADDDRTVTYGDAYDFSFESSEGLAQTIRVSSKSLVELGADPAKLAKLTVVKMVGDVHVHEKGGFFRPTAVYPVKA